MCGKGSRVQDFASTVGCVGRTVGQNGVLHMIREDFTFLCQPLSATPL